MADDLEELDTIEAAYVRCALWSSTNGDGEPLDGLGIDPSDDAKRDMRESCREFLDLLEEEGVEWRERIDASQFGHDYWLTRNHHGAGFWDRGLGELGETLTKWAQSMGSSDLYVGDDGEVHVS